MGSALKVPPSELDHRIGHLNASVVLVEYGDYECPYTRVSNQIIERLLNEFEHDLCFIFRHFTMNNIHPHAELAALATEAADEQHRFWEMHRLLLATDEDLTSETIGVLAQSIGLNMDQFIDDFQRSDLLERIHRNAKGGIKSGVDSTPTFFLNGYRYEESTSYKPMKDAILELINIGPSAYF